ncbi:MAG: divalent-cation tolerance protein CutA [Deltaproteobacteria bacterium]|nr:MAG: divalent-cation tolerance protein CutA [Deltaproteobacteria bacterium]
MSIRFVYITASSEEEAERIGRKIVEHRLAACANIVKSIRSFYWWEGAVQEDNEAVLILKTRQELMEELIEKVRSLHSYDVPCIVSLRVLEGNPEFLKWVEEETGLPK